MCKWSDPFSKSVLIDRGLDHNSLETLRVNEKMWAVIIQFWRHVLLRNTGQTVDRMVYWASHMVGDDDGEVPPVPIPNTEVKLTRAQDSSLETARENR